MLKDRLELIKWVKSLVNPSKVVEVGVFQGGYAQHINTAFPDADLHLVDMWEKEGNIPGMFETEDEANSTYKRVVSKFFGVPGINIHKMSSNDASRLFSDDSVDWVYIDANHSYESVRDDIGLWLPKVRVGGVISGHDYSPDPKNVNSHEYGVNRAVNEEFGEFVGLTGEKFYKSWYHIK